MEFIKENSVLLLLTEFMLTLLIILAMALKSEQHTQQINATLLSQGVGANSIRCVSGDAISCALATQESMASPIIPVEAETQVPKQE